MKVVWFSRHRPLPSQLRELRRLFGEDVEVIPDANPFASADDVVARFRQSGATEIVVVAPLSVLAKLTERGLRPLWAEMESVRPEEAELRGAGRYYRFRRFRRVRSVTVDYEDFDEENHNDNRG